MPIVEFPDGTRQAVTDQQLKLLSGMKNPRPLDGVQILPPIGLSMSPKSTQVDKSGGDIGSRSDLLSGVGTVARHGIPMAVQGGIGMLAGPEAGLAAKVAMDALGSVGGYLAGGALEAAQGKPSGLSVRGAAENAALGGGFSGAMAGGAGMLRWLLGKGALLKEGGKAAGDAAEDLAREGHFAKLKQATSRVDSALGAIDDRTKDVSKALEQLSSSEQGVRSEVLKHSENALQGVREAEVERLVKQGLGPAAPITQPITIESLTRDTEPIQKATTKAISGVFRGLSQKFNEVLEPFRAEQVKSTLKDAAKAVRSNLIAENRSVSPQMKKLMAFASGRLPAEEKTAAGAMTLQGRPLNFTRGVTTDAERNRLARLLDASGRPVSSEQEQILKHPTVDSHLGLREQFSKIVRESKNPTDKRAAADMIEAIDNDIERVVPEEQRQLLAQYRDEWHQAKSTFSNAFRSRLFRASSPDQVAEALYTGAKTGRNMSQRAALVVNQMKAEAPEDLPKLRSAFASMIANNPKGVDEIEKMDPSLFKALFPGTGFDDPKKWTEALRGGVNIQRIARSPELMAKWSTAFQSGMNSLGTRAKQAAMREAEDNLRNIPDQQEYIRSALAGMQTPDEAAKIATLGMPSPGEAFEEAGMKAMKRPLGSGIQHYMEHRVLIHGMLSLGAFSATHNPTAWAAPLIYLGSSKALGAMLDKPKIARMYYNMLTSKSLEKSAFYAGRLTASALSEAARAGSEETP